VKQEAHGLRSQVQMLEEGKAQLESLLQQKSNDLVTLKRLERRAQVDRLR
jgi:uncharacterized protein involved in exopolysaccharide biosynthesis